MLNILKHQHHSFQYLQLYTTDGRVELMVRKKVWNAYFGLLRTKIRNQLLHSVYENIENYHIDLI